MSHRPGACTHCKKLKVRQKLCDDFVLLTIAFSHYLHGSALIFDLSFLGYLCFGTNHPWSTGARVSILPALRHYLDPIAALPHVTNTEMQIDEVRFSEEREYMQTVQVGWPCVYRRGTQA